MHHDEFKRILTTFADNPADIDLSKGKLLVQIRDEIIEAGIFNKEGDVYINESDTNYPSYQWLVNRIARIPQLADRILSYIPEESHFVTPTGQLLDQLDVAPTSDSVEVNDAVECARELLSRRPAGTSSALYLTSDAGEGKTTLINRIARVQAAAFKRKETDWLLVPVSLGGRPFLRFDDVVIGALVNRLRFQFLYYDAFIELVKLGVLVPAFDGFEEMFVETSSGEALSALGNLMNVLHSSGSVLISARKAYFEYMSFANQAKLFDALEVNSVAFSRLALNRWDREQFLFYCSLRDIRNGEEIFADVSARLADTRHPILTRAVLVKRLLDIAANAEGREALLSKLGHAPHDYFFEFVNAIIEREANEKWIDRSGQIARPLITVEEHHELLSLIAQEMWLVNSEVLKDESLELIAELFSELHEKSPMISRQVKERIKQHALISRVSGSQAAFAFDHEEFRYFFLGQAVGRRIDDNNESDLRNMLRSAALPKQAFSAASQFLRRLKHNPKKGVQLLENLSKADTVASFTRENCGGIIIRLLDGQDWKNTSISKVTFPPDSLRGRHITGVRFNDCYFQSTSLTGAMLVSCEFHSCRFDCIELTRDAALNNAVLASCEIVSVIDSQHDNSIFDPEAINETLRTAGFTLQLPVVSRPPVEPPRQPDEELQLTERALRCFLRSTHISENTFRVRLGVKANAFFDEVLPELKRNQIIDELPPTGGGNQNRYRLSVHMHEIDNAMSHSNGDFSRFLTHFTQA